MVGHDQTALRCFLPFIWGVSDEEDEEELDEEELEDDELSDS